jgi:hypothetical protein
MISQRVLRSSLRLNRAAFAQRLASSSSHNTDSYNKDVDSTPPQDSKIHRVDASSDAAHKPHEPAPSMETQPTETTSKEHPYTPKGGDKSKDLRYGGEGKYQPSDSHKGSGPDGANAGGRKPEKNS